jgi:uncharacterized protein (DUF58 family)
MGGAMTDPGSMQRAWWKRSETAVTPPAADVPDIATRAAYLRRLDLTIKKRLDGLLAGEFLGILPGPGTERSGGRVYGPGDDARRIDWSLTARSLAPHIRTTDADRELETWLVVDRSASLDFGTTVREKRELALCAVAAFGSLAQRGANRVGMMVSGGDALVRFDPKGGRTALFGMLSRLDRMPRLLQAPGTAASLTSALNQLQRIQIRRGQVIVISDFLEHDDWARALRRLSLHHQVVAVQVIDPREFTVPAMGILGLIDPETGQTMHVQTNSEGLRERFAQAAQARHQGIANQLRHAGAAHIVLSTEDDWLREIVRFVSIRRSRGGGNAVVTQHHRQVAQ